MQPQIRYVTSADGVRIAVHTLGRGRPCVILPTMWLTSGAVYWHVPETLANLERLAERHLIAQYDSRGYGLSERDATDYSLAARVGDLTSVVESLGVQRVDLLAIAQAGTAAINYAATHPERVSRLVLADSLARGRDIITPPRLRAMRPLLDFDWELYVRATTMDLFNWTEIGLRVSQVVVDDTSPEVFLAALRAARDDDVTGILGEVRCPTLILHGRASQVVSLDSSRRLAAAIPDALFAMYENTHPLVTGEERAMQAITAFLDEQSDEAPRESAVPSGTAIILFADIADSTALTERFGDSAFRDSARTLDSHLRSVVRDAAGICIEGKLLGDGMLAVFPSARQAIESALACGAAGNRYGLPLHIGLHAGDVIHEDNNVYGGAVNVASRISGLSSPGEVLVSDIVRGLARTSAGVRFEDRGEKALKGVGELVRIWAVVPEERG
jgi:class 3 adenylate cyclase